MSWSIYDVSAIHYVLPVLWTMSRSHIMELMTQNQRQLCFGGTGGKVAVYERRLVSGVIPGWA